MNSVFEAKRSIEPAYGMRLSEYQNLILKIYNSLLSNNTIQNGISTLSRFSEPLWKKFDDNLLKLTNSISTWICSDNVYNKLTNVWIAHNIPLSGTVVSFQTFSKEFNSCLTNRQRQQTELIVKTFYNVASEIWKSLDEPTSHDFQHALLAIVAKVMNKIYNFEGDSLATALYNMLRMILEKRRELVSLDSFFNLVKNSLGDIYYESNQQTIRKACEDYYIFAKRILLIDFPIMIKHENFLTICVKFLQENSFFYGDSSLNFVEKRINILLKICGQKVNDYFEENLAQKAQRILKKILTLATFPIENIFYQIKASQFYASVHNSLQIGEKIDNALALSILGYSHLKENIFEPTFQAVDFIIQKSKCKITIVMQDVNVQLIKKKYTKLCTQFEVLKKCAMIFGQDAIKIIFNARSRAECKKHVQKDFLRIYQEIKTMEKERIKNISLEYYTRILKRTQKVYKRAQKVVRYQKKDEKKALNKNLNEETLDTKNELNIDKSE